MICPRSIRRLTPEERARHDEQHQARYAELYAEIEAAERAEYDEQFGPFYRERHPFTLDGVRVHYKVLQRMSNE
jgi:hypothetical protein